MIGMSQWCDDGRVSFPRLVDCPENDDFLWAMWYFGISHTLYGGRLEVSRM